MPDLLERVQKLKGEMAQRGWPVATYIAGMLLLEVADNLTMEVEASSAEESNVGVEPS